MTADDDPPLYRQISAELLFDPLANLVTARLSVGEGVLVPALARQLGASRILAAGGSTDHLVERTDNSLRPDDLQLPQPPQDPNWRPS